MADKVDPETKAKIEADMAELDGSAKTKGKDSAPISHFAKCTDCNGTGLVDGPLVKELCPTCKGGGKQLVDQEATA